MPLAFESRSHGTIAFGFFNIDTDLLLLENLFFFADDFCALVEDLAQGPLPFSGRLGGWVIREREKIGDLHGAIGGCNLTGFIGRVYELFPFPQDPAAFKQKPEGDRNRAEVEALLAPWAERETIPVRVPSSDPGAAIGGFDFAPAVFRRLVEYVWLGGMPRWRDGIRPDYVERMGQKLGGQRAGLFAGLNLG